MATNKVNTRPTDANLNITDVTTNNASTTKHGFLIKATAPASGLLNVVGIGNGETSYANKAIFDTTAPEAVGTAAAGTQLVSARRDHVHASVGRFITSGLLTSASANHTTNALTTKIKVIVQAGGGGGAGNTGASAQVAMGGGGGGGGYAIKVFTVVGSTNYAYTCGAAGTNVSNSVGGTGGDSTFVVGATTVTAKGGVGGGQSASGTALGSLAGSAGGAVSTNGDVNVGGQPSSYSLRISSSAGVAADGATSHFGAGGAGRNTQGNGSAATGYGAGGGGSVSINAGGATTGGAAGAGCIWYEEYS